MIFLWPVVTITVAIGAAIFANDYGEKFVEDEVEKAKKKGIQQGKDIIDDKIQSFVSVLKLKTRLAMLKATYKILAIVIAVLVLPYVLPRSWIVFIVVNLYIIILVWNIYGILTSVITIIKAQGGLREFRKSVEGIYKQYKLNYPKMIADKVYNEVLRQAKNKATKETEGFAYWLFGKQSALAISKEIAKAVSAYAEESVKFKTLLKQYIKKREVIILVIMLIHYALCRYVVIPYLAEGAKSMGIVETLIYPYLFSVEYYVHTLK